MSPTRSMLIAIAALAVAAVPAQAATVDISDDNAEANTAFQAKYGISIACPDTATIKVPFTCTYANERGVTAPVRYVIRKAGEDRVPVSDRQETKALGRVIPLAYWIGVSVDAYEQQKELKGADVSCPTTATSPNERVTCTFTKKGGGDSADVEMRFKAVKPFGWFLKPVKQKQLAIAILTVG